MKTKYTNGFIEKYKANASRLDDSELAKIVADMEAGGYDANPDQWERLDAAVAALPEETPDEKERREQAEADGTWKRRAPSATGAAGDDRYASGSPPGSPDNPIGWPGTTQDQEAPGTVPRNVPGQKVTKKPDEK